MTPRPLARMRRAVAGLAVIVGLVSLVGCDPRALFYFLQPFEPTIKPPCPSLKGKRVVVLASAAREALDEEQAIDQEVAQKLAAILRQKVKKIDVVDPAKVRTWSDANKWTDPAEAARAFEADVVIFLEVESFEVTNPSSPGMLEGKARVHVQATELRAPKDPSGHEIPDKPKEAEIIHDDYRDVAFPVQGPIPMDVRISRQTFKKKFLTLVATEVSWHFVEHAPGDNIQDTKFNDQ